MGLFDLPSPVLGLADSELAVLMPPAWRLVAWGLVAGIAATLLYGAISPQRSIAEARRRIADAQRALDRHEGAFADAGPLIGAMLGQALRQVGLVAAPALVAGLPVLSLIVWLGTAYGYALPAGSVDVRVTPADLHAELRRPAAPPADAGAGAEVVVTDPQAEAALALPLAAPIPTLHKRLWWNALVGNPAGYLPDDGRAERVDIALPRQEHLGVGPPWLRGWEAPFFAALLLSALLAKLALRIH
jgi:hypothetical protein